MKRLISLLLIFAILTSISTTAFAIDNNVVDDQTSENAFDCEAHDNQAIRKDVMLMSLSNTSQMVGNNYIEFYVADANDTENSGRFTVGNSGGNPNYSSDDGKILLFGHPSPWSSYTTIRINNRNYIFHAENTTFDSDNLCAVSTMTADDVLITQTLQIVLNEGTGLKDTVKISYTAQNKSTSEKSVAIRIMLDTMLGNNDGAPFKVPSLGNVTTEKELVGNAIPSYWQAFDSLTNASVFAVGTLYKENDRKPDKVQFTNWGNVYDSDNAWQYSIDSSTAVTGDSAVSIYWNALNLSPNASTAVSTYYGVGYADSGSGSIEGSSEVPTNGFAVQIVDENGQPIEGVSVEVSNILRHPSEVTAADGIAIFDALPAGNGNTREVQLKISKQGYQSITAAERYVDKGGLTSVTICPDDGKAHVLAAMGTIDGSNVDLLNNYKYFKANSSDVSEAEDGRNVKDFVITVTASADAQISKYQLLQGGAIVAESITSTIRIPVLTGTENDPSSFGNDWRITKLKAGQIVYLRVVDVNGVASDRKALGIRVSEPTLYSASDSSGKLNFGEKLKINVPSNIPIIGDTEIELGWNGLPFVFEVSQSGKVKFAINPKSNPLSKSSVDGTDLSNWDEVAKEYSDAMEQVAFGRSAAAKAFGGKPQSFGAGKLSVDASFMGYGEGYIDDNGNIIVDVGLVITISEEGSYTWTFFLGYVPVYVAVGEKVSVSGSGQINVARTNGEFHISGAVGEINPKITLNVDGGVGANGVLSIGASGRATLSWLNRWTDNYNRVDLTGEAYIVAKAFLFKAEKKLASGTWTIYDSYASRTARYAAMRNGTFYDSAEYVPIERNYLDVPMLFSAERSTVKAGVYPDADPQLVEVNDSYYLFWLDDISTRADNDRTALVYSISEDTEVWSEPVQVISEPAEGGTADFSYDICVEDSKIHIAISKAKEQFGSDSVTLDQMAASAEIYYAVLDTENNTVSSPERITNNNYADVTPSVAAFNNRVFVACATNQLETGLFGAENTHSISYQEIGGDLTAIPVTGLVSALDAGILDGTFSLSYVVDSDSNYDTDEDKKLYVTSDNDIGSVVAEANVCSPTFANVNGQNLLLWYSSENIAYIEAVDDRISYVFEDVVPSEFGHSFYVTEGPNAKIIWEAMSTDETKNTTAVYAVDYNNGWSNAYVLFENDSELTYSLSGTSNGNNDIIVYLKTVGVAEDEQISSLCVETIQPPTDIAVLGIDYSMNEVSPGELLALDVVLENCGATTIDAVDVQVNNGNVANLTNLNLMRGETATYSVNYLVPDNLSEVESLTLSVSTNNDWNIANNSLDFEIGYTDLSVVVRRMLVNGEDAISISVVNESQIETAGTLRIIADVEDGAVLYEERFDGLDNSKSKAILLNLAALTNGANVNAFYVTVVAEEDELVTFDNQSIVYTGLGTTVKNTLTVTATNGGTISGNHGGLYAEDEVIEIEAVAQNGYHFVGWTSSNGGVFGDATANHTTFTMPEVDVTVTAIFEEDAPPTKYDVTVNGSYATTTGAGEYEAGATVNISAGTRNGYTFAGWTSSDVTIANASSQTATFVMPDHNVTVTATFEKIETPVVPTFDDVAEDTYYFDAVEWAVKNGITAGTSATTFSPDMTCTRAQAVTFLWRAAGSPAPKSNVMPFEDVAAEAYYYNAVLWAVENGITAGTSATTFSPDAECTRAQIVTFLWRSQKSLLTIGANPFADVIADTYYADAVLWAVEKKITAGTSATTFSPDADCTRAQIVTFLYRCLGDK